MIYSLKEAQKVYLGSQEVSKILLRGLEIFSSISADPYSDYVTLLTHFNTDFSDSSTNNIVLPAFGSPQISTSIKKFGNSSLFLDGNNSYLSASKDPAFEFLGDFTIEFWHYPITFNSETNLLSLFTNLSLGDRESTTPGIAILLLGNGTGQYVFNYPPIVSVLLPVAPILNQWNHFALVRLNSQLTLYSNGINIYRRTLTEPLTSSSCLIGAFVGHSNLFYDTVSGFYRGYIDDIRITKGIARYTENFTPPTSEFPNPSDPYGDNVSLLLHMDDLSGSTTFIDSSTNNFTLTPFGNAQISTVTKKFGNGAAYFDGSSRIRVFGDPAFALGNEDFTIEFWVYVDIAQCQNFATILQCGRTNEFQAGSWQLVRGPQGLGNSTPFQLSFEYSNGFGSSSFIIDTLNDQTWNHVAIARYTPPGSIQFTNCFINGNSIVQTAGLIGFTQQQITIGSNSTGTRNFGGYIDELRITKGVARYTSNFVPQTAPFANPITITPPIFTPASIPGLVTRFNADSGVAVSGGLITSWTDQQNGIVATAFNGPTLLTGTFNGRNAVSLDGLNDFFTGNFNTGLASDTGRTFVIIGKYNTATGQTGMFDGSTDLQAYIFQNSGSLYYNNGPQIGPIVGNFTTNYFIQIINTSDSSGTTVYRVNGVQGASGSMNRPAMTGFNIGRRGNQGEYANCNIVELLVYNRSLTLTEMQSLETYANTI